MSSPDCAAGAPRNSCGRGRAIKVTLRPKAEDDLNAIFDYVTAEAGARVADDYLKRIETAIYALAVFPLRGAARDDIAPGARVIGLERRVAIVFRVLPSEVEVLHVLYAGQDLRRFVENGA